MAILDEIKKKTKSIAWFSDDQWRLHNYSRFYAPHFTWVVTVWSKAQELYAKYGIKNIIQSQCAFNTNKLKITNSYKELLAQDIDVSFVGHRTAKRANIINELRREGINVYVRGLGWPEGKVSDEEMVKIFLRSKINLNINQPPGLALWKVFARLFLKRSNGKIVPDFWHFKDNLKSMLSLRTPQMKARIFEVLGCHAFLISGYNEDMDQYYENGKEIVYYDGTITDLVYKIRYYLKHNEEREKIADAGYKRTLREHTYEKRFEDIFKKLGLSRQ
jgi:spore maturation protein CgeB